MNWTIIWLVLLVFFVVIELETMGLTTIWFAGGALIATILAVLGVGIPVQIVVFLLISIVLLIFTRPIALKYFNKDRQKTNVESWIGKQAIVVEEIENIRNQGKATLNGMEWSAKASDDGVIIPSGTIVTVVGIAGVKLIVEERKEGV